MINSDNLIQIDIKFTFTVFEYIIVYEYIYIYLYLSIYLSVYLYIYLYIYIHIYLTLCFLFIATSSQLIHTIATLVSHSYNLFQLVLLVETTDPIVNMIQVINKEARAT